MNFHRPNCPRTLKGRGPINNDQSHHIWILKSVSASNIPGINRQDLASKCEKVLSNKAKDDINPIIGFYGKKIPNSKPTQRSWSN
jgi:hypothetical protein